MDRFSAVASAYVRVLVLPVGQIERSIFLGLVSNLRSSASVLQLESLRPLVDSDDFLLSPLQAQGGSILFNYTVSEVPEPQRQLAPFELCRETLLVLGITSSISKNADQQETELKSALDELREKHGRVVHRHLLVLETDKENPFTSSSIVTTLGPDGIVQAMQRIAVQFLYDFTTYAKAMQASPSIQTPGQISQGMLRSLMLREDDRPRSRHSTPGEPRSPSGEESTSRPLSQEVMPPATNFDQMPAANTLGRSDSTTSGRSKSRSRTTSFDRVPTLSKEKLKDRGKARVGIVTGSISLMSGHWAEALKILVDNTTRLRALNDHLWNAKGLELIVVCLLLHLWAGLDVQIPAICYQLSDKVRDRFSKAFAAELAQKISGPQTPAEKLSSSLPDLLKHILVLYHSIEGTMELPYITIAEATVRLSKILACMHSTNGLLDEKSIPRIVESKPPAKLKWSSCSFQGQKSLSKTSISDLLSHALPVSDDTVPLSDYIGMLTGIASVYGLLGMARKKAITLKTLVARLTSAINQARKVGAAEVGIHPAASLSIDNGTEALLDTMQGSSGLTQLARDLASVYGVQLGPEDIEETSASTSNAQCNDFGSTMLKLETLRDLLRLCEASPDLRGISSLVLAFMATAGQYESLDVISEHRSLAVAAEEQTRLLGMLGKASWLSRQLALPPVEGRYWDPFLVRNIELHAPPIEQALYELSAGHAVSTTVSSGNPLLYDPNAARNITKEQSIVLPLGETASFRLTLQNSFDVSIDIEHIELVIDGVALKCSRRNIRLGPARLEHILVDVLPEEVGNTKVTGCCIKIAGCAAQTFLLKRLPWTFKHNTILKAIGQDAWNSTTSTQASAVQYDEVSVNIIEAQPQVLLQNSSSTPTLMLLEGEKLPYSVVLENISDVPASVLSTSCLTSSLIPAKTKAEQIIAPHKSSTQEFSIIGVAGASNAQASITYAASAKSKYTRVCKLSLNLTVKSVIHIQRLHVLESGNDRLIFTLDLWNLWTHPVQYRLYASTSQSQAQGTLQVGQTTRVQLQAARWSTSHVGPNDLATIKQELVKHLHLAWQAADRSGEVPLDNVELSPEAIRVLNGPAIDVSLALLDAKSEATKKQVATAGEFAVVRVTLKNRSAAVGPMVVSLSCHLPHAGSAADGRAAIAGSMSRLVPALASEKTTDVDFALCPLLAGALAFEASYRSALPIEPAIEGTSTQSLHILVVA